MSLIFNSYRPTYIQYKIRELPATHQSTQQQIIESSQDDLTSNEVKTFINNGSRDDKKASHSIFPLMLPLSRLTHFYPCLGGSIINFHQSIALFLSPENDIVSFCDENKSGKMSPPLASPFMNIHVVSCARKARQSKAKRENHFRIIWTHSNENQMEKAGGNDESFALVCWPSAIQIFYENYVLKIDCPLLYFTTHFCIHRMSFRFVNVGIWL